MICSEILGFLQLLKRFCHLQGGRNGDGLCEILKIIHASEESIFYDIIDKNVDIAIDFFKGKIK